MYHRIGKASRAWPSQSVEQQDRTMAVVFPNQKMCLTEEVTTCATFGWPEHCCLLHEKCHWISWECEASLGSVFGRKGRLKEKSVKKRGFARSADHRAIWFSFCSTFLSCTRLLLSWRPICSSSPETWFNLKCSLVLWHCHRVISYNLNKVCLPFKSML